MQSAAFVEIDVHGQTKAEAKRSIDYALSKAGRGVYRLRVIHGYRGGTQLRDMVRSIYASHPKVLRVATGFNPGETDLVLREL